MFTLNFKTIFKQVDFWLQFLHICVTTLALWLIPDNAVIMRNYIMKVHTVVFGVFGLAFLQILSAIFNFLIYKKERNSQRKFYEKLTPAFILALFLIYYFFDLTQGENKSFIHAGSLIVQVGLLFISPFLAMWYLSITFREFLKTLKFAKFGNWWQVPLILIVLIFAILGVFLVLTTQSY